MQFKYTAPVRSFDHGPNGGCQKTQPVVRSLRSKYRPGRPPCQHARPQIATKTIVLLGPCYKALYILSRKMVLIPCR